MYRAYFATVLSFGPFSALYFMFYEHMKGLVVSNDPLTYLAKLKSSKKDAPVNTDIGFF